MSKTKKMKGKAWVFGDILDVDFDICPIEAVSGRMGRPQTDEDWGALCMVNVDPEFHKKVKKGDFFVAGENVGYGHDHTHASKALKACGIAAVIAESTNFYFQRNSINLGLPVIELKGIKSKVKEGDELEVDLNTGVIKNITTGEELRFAPYPDFLLEIIDAGGVYPLIKKKFAKGELPIYACVTPSQ